MSGPRAGSSTAGGARLWGDRTRGRGSSDSVDRLRAAAMVVLAIVLGLLHPPIADAQSNDPGGATAPGAARRILTRIGPSDWAAAETVPDTLRVSPGDGRPVVELPVVRREEGRYIDLTDLARATGNRFRWDPETWRGSFTVDSVDVVIVLDTPVVWAGPEAVQLPAPVRYVADRVWLPVTIVGGVLVPLLGERARWDATAGTLELAGKPPLLRTVRLRARGGRAELWLSPAPAGSVQVRWDPMGILYAQVRGVGAPLALEPEGERIEGLRIESIRPAGGGVEVGLAVGPGWVGVRGRPETEGGVDGIALELTRREEEVEDGLFRQLGAYRRPSPPQRDGRGARRTIVLEVGERTTAGSASAECLRRLADRLAEVLEVEFGHEVLETPDRSTPGLLESPSGRPETPGLPRADLWLALRLERWPSDAAREFVIVVPGTAAREDRVDVLADAFTPATARAAGIGGEEQGLLLAGLRLPPWGQVPRFYEAPSRALARTIADHIDWEFELRPVRIQSRPSRLFRGLAMPGAVLYPASANDREAVDALCNPSAGAELARDIAFALDEFLLGLGREP